MKTLKIRNGFFYGAGSTYKWKDDYHTFGVGIARPYFDEKEIIVEVAKHKYKLDMAKAMKFVKKYRAIRMIKGTKIGIVSKDLLKPYVTTKRQTQFDKDVEWFDNEL